MFSVQVEGFLYKLVFSELTPKVFGMPATIDEMVSKGTSKLTTKAASMKTSYSGALSRMKTNYGAQPFGPVRKANYNSGVDAGAGRYRVDPTKWATNWRAKMSE